VARRSLCSLYSMPPSGDVPAADDSWAGEIIMLDSVERVGCHFDGGRDRSRGAAEQPAAAAGGRQVRGYFTGDIRPPRLSGSVRRSVSSQRVQMQDTRELVGPFGAIPKGRGVTLLVLVALVVFAVGCLFSLWRRPGRLSERILWTFIILVPLLGPIAYLAWYRPLGPTVGPVARNTHSDLMGSPYDRFH